MEINIMYKCPCCDLNCHKQINLKYDNCEDLNEITSKPFFIYKINTGMYFDEKFQDDNGNIAEIETGYDSV